MAETPLEKQKQYRQEAQDNLFMFHMWAEGYIELYDYAVQLEASLKFIAGADLSEGSNMFAMAVAMRDSAKRALGGE